MLYVVRRRRKNHVILLIVLLTLFIILWRRDTLFDDSTDNAARIKREIAMFSAGLSGRHYHIYEAGKRMAERLKRIEQLCKASPARPQQANHLQSSQVLISQRNRFLHCSVTKAASTFWQRFLQALNVSGPMQSPFTAPIKDVTGTPTSSLNSIRHSDEQAAFVTSAFRNIFVRNPYSRMFSAYVDKVFAPNPSFWKLWGRKAIKVFRKDADPKSVRCGHNVTFAETMAFATKRLYLSDIHFQPMFHQCNPCRFHYHFIGKMETFSEDIVLLAKTLNLSVVPYFQSQQFRLDYIRDAIEDSINSPFSWLSEILRCMSKYEAGLRIWRKLQIRGLVSRRIKFPFPEAVFQGVTAQQLVQAALDAHWRSVENQEELQRQKIEAFVEAYRSVPKSMMEKWVRILGEDFATFGYNPRPEKMFDDSVTARRGAFDWGSDW